MKPTKQEITSLLEDFHRVCKNDPDKGIPYFTGFMMSAFAEIAAYPEKIESELEIIKDIINEKTNETANN